VGIARHPAVLFAIDPRHALTYLFSNRCSQLSGPRRRVPLRPRGLKRFTADMAISGGADPVCLDGLGISSLVLNYAGQPRSFFKESPARATSSSGFALRRCSFAIVACPSTVADDHAQPNSHHQQAQF